MSGISMGGAGEVVERCGVHTLVTDVAVIAEGKVALVKYRDPEQYDGEAGWFLPDDGMNHLEHPQATAKRILQEQLGLERSGGLKLRHFESFKGNRGTWHLSWHYLIEYPHKPEPKLGAMVGELRWFSLDSLPPSKEVAHHGWALQILRAMRREVP
jgi:ADP-ribose pyrophosphatase YjhB (NUDIX family)